VLETDAAGVLHDEVVHGAVLAEVVHADDVRVVEHGGGAGFAEEPFARHFVRGRGHGEHLDRREAVHDVVFGEENLAGAAAAELVEDDVVAE
jgi:hypothetical protein